MTCPVCNSSNDKTINDVFLITKHEIQNLADGKRYHFGNVDLKQCRTCGVLRT